MLLDDVLRSVSSIHTLTSRQSVARIKAATEPNLPNCARVLYGRQAEWVCAIEKQRYREIREREKKRQTERDERGDGQREAERRREKEREKRRDEEKRRERRIGKNN